MQVGNYIAHGLQNITKCTNYKVVVKSVNVNVKVIVPST